MKNKIKDYIKKIDNEIDRLHQWLEEHISCNACIASETDGRIKALLDVKADLEYILDRHIKSRWIMDMSALLVLDLNMRRGDVALVVVK